MTNPYKKHLDELFSNLLEYKHTTQRFTTVLKKDAETYSKDEASFHSIAVLFISDWSGQTVNGWELPFPTGSIREIEKHNYHLEVEKIITRECCLIYSQSFECLEKNFKDSVFTKAKHKDHIEDAIKKSLRPGQKLTRKTVPGGDSLFKLIKLSGGNTFIELSKKSNINLEFGTLWSILSEVRHSITHSRSMIEKSKINHSNYHIFKSLFRHSEIDEDSFQIEIDYKNLEQLIKTISEFAFQIFKILSLEENYEWQFKE